jgi:hypothetical protein
MRKVLRPDRLDQIFPSLSSTLEQMFNWCSKFNMALLPSHAVVPTNLWCWNSSLSHDQKIPLTNVYGPELHKNYPSGFLADLAQGTQGYYNIYPVFLPICTMATAVKAMYTGYDRVFGCDLNPHFPYMFLITRKTLNSKRVIPSLQL